MRNPRFAEWRKQFTGDVTITDYGVNRRAGKVISEFGLKTRILPAKDSQERARRLNWGEDLDWRFLISTGENVWIVLGENLVVPHIIELQTLRGIERFESTTSVNTLDLEEAKVTMQRRISSFDGRLIELSVERRYAEAAFAGLREGGETHIYPSYSSFQLS